MDITLNGALVIELAAVLGALAALLAFIAKAFRWFERQRLQDAEIKALEERLENEIEDIRKEDCIICRALLATLDGLAQLGANGDVSKTRSKLSEYLTSRAHK